MLFVIPRILNSCFTLLPTYLGKSKDLIESIEEAPESSKASDVDISESIEDIQQYITATAKKDEKQVNTYGYFKFHYRNKN